MRTPPGPPPPDVDPLDETVGRAVRGDERAFQVLWEALQPALVRYLAVVGTPSSAEDLASETWTQVIRDLHRFEGDARAFRAWLLSVGRHRVVDAARRRNRLRRRPRPIDSGSAPSAEDHVVAGLGTGAALALLADLPPRQAEAVALRVVADLDTDAAARVAGTSAGAFRVNLHRGLRALAADPRLQALQEYA